MTLNSLVTVCALIAGVIGTIASFLYVLDYFGITKDDWRKAWWPMPNSQRWKLLLMIVLVGFSLSLSGYGFYRAIRPKIVEKLIERPIDRIVEKIITVPRECPPTEKHSTTSVKPHPDAPQPALKQDCGGGNCAQSVGQQGGITAGQVNLGMPDRHLTVGQKTLIAAYLIGKKCKVTMIGGLMNVEDAIGYAAEIRDALKDGGCDVPATVLPMMNSAGGWIGVKINYHDNFPHGDNEQVSIDPNTPQGIVVGALKQGRVANTVVGASPDNPTDVVQVFVGRQGK